MMQSLKKNYLLVPKMTWMNFMMQAVASLRIFTLIGYFCGKYVIFELKKYTGVVSWKMFYGFKNDISDLVNFRLISWN